MNKTHNSRTQATGPREPLRKHIMYHKTNEPNKYQSSPHKPSCDRLCSTLLPNPYRHSNISTWDTLGIVYHVNQRAPSCRPAGGWHSTKCPAGFLSVVIILTTLKKDMIFPSPWERGRPIYFGLSGRPTHMPAEGQVPLGLSHVYRRLLLRSILPPTPRIPPKETNRYARRPHQRPHTLMN